jgi:glycosyltransferase involved in cell wall biosynthesis
MNIVITTDYFPPHIGGGVEVVTYHLARELTQLGHTVAVVTLNTDNSKRLENLDGVLVYRASQIELTQRLGIQSAFSFEAVKLIDDACRNADAHILHANNLYFSTTLAACFVSKLRKLPLVTTLHVTDTAQLGGYIAWFARMYERSMGQMVLNCSKRVVAVSRAVMRQAEDFGVAPSRLSVVPNAVDLEQFTPLGHANRENDKVRVGFVGRLLSNKGPQFLLEAAAQAVKECPNLEFFLVGEGPLRNYLDQQVNRLGLNDHLHFLGIIPDVAEFLRQCDVFVRPSLTEGMPLTVLEAMATGVPTIASRVGGTPEIIIDGENGFLIEPKNICQLRDCLVRLATDEELRWSMGQRGRTYVEERYSWRSVAVEMVRVYEQISNCYNS